jgi:hypothetical protein
MGLVRHVVLAPLVLPLAVALRRKSRRVDYTLSYRLVGPYHPEVGIGYRLSVVLLVLRLI